jgi:hypothetical protein
MKEYWIGGIMSELLKNRISMRKIKQNFYDSNPHSSILPKFHHSMSGVTW